MSSTADGRRPSRGAGSAARPKKKALRVTFDIPVHAEFLQDAGIDVDMSNPRSPRLQIDRQRMAGAIELGSPDAEKVADALALLIDWWGLRADLIRRVP